MPLARRAPLPRLPATAGGELCAGPGACHLCASGAPCSQRAAHVPVPLARCDPPPACQGRRRRGRRACHLCVPHPARRDHSESSTPSCRSRDMSLCLPDTAGGGLCAGRATCVATLARRNRSEPSTSPCRSREVTNRPPATAGSGMCAWRATRGCRIQRVAIVASRARRRAARAMRPPARLSWPAAGYAPSVPRVCAASGASRSQRAEHFPVPLARRDPPPASYGRRLGSRRTCHLCVPRQRVAFAASRPVSVPLVRCVRPRPPRPQLSPDTVASEAGDGGGPCAHPSGGTPEYSQCALTRARGLPRAHAISPTPCHGGRLRLGRAAPHRRCVPCSLFS